MGIFSKDIQTMNDLFVHTLRDILYAEKQILKALPSMVDKATDPDLKQGFADHLEETRMHVARLDDAFQMLDETAKTVSCPAIDGILKEANEIAGDIDDKNVLDAALIMAAQAVEHYEITRYGTLIAWANQLGRDDVAAALGQTLDEEKAADEKLTMLAERNINAEAAEAA
jgi:ferritin-like metal-binding protein YciE